jgi:hypothetical protein
VPSTRGRWQQEEGRGTSAAGSAARDLEIASESAGGTQDKRHKLGRQRGLSKFFSNKKEAPASSVSALPSSSSGSTPAAFLVPSRG